MYLFRFAGAAHRRLVGLLTNEQALTSDMYLGWCSFNTLDSVLQHVGPLLASCACSTTHPSLRGLAAKGGFKSFLAQTLGPRFLGPHPSARCKTLSFTVPFGMEFLLFRAVQLV